MTEIKTELHILNGDFALGIWRQCGFTGQSLVWRESYLEGPLPETEDLRVFWAARAEYLSHFVELTDMDKSDIYHHLQRMDEAILGLPDKSTLRLWFDSCIFDQTILMRIMYLLNRNKADVTVFLNCCDSFCLGKDDFKEGNSKRIQLLPHDFEVAEEAWFHFIRKDPKGLMRIIERERFERMPQMRVALLRCVDEIPDSRGLTRTHRQILKLIADGRHSFIEIFKGLDTFEEFPFLGDTACQRQLDYLERNSFLVRHQDAYELGEYGIPSL